MKLWDIVKTVGTGLISATVPGAGLLIGAVNEFLPDDKKLPQNATGQQLGDAVNSLPPEQRASLMEKEFDVQITEIKEAHSTVRTMLESDAKNPHTTRPYIAKHSFHVIGFCSVVTILLWAHAVFTANELVVKAIMDGWPFVVGILAPFVVLLRTYFGVLKIEHKQKLNAANGQSNGPEGITGLISAFMKR